MALLNFQPIRIELEENGARTVLEGSLPLTLEAGEYKGPNADTADISTLPTWLADWLHSTELDGISGNIETNQISNYSRSLYKLAQYLLPQLKPSETRFQLFARYVVFLSLAAQHEEMVKMQGSNATLNKMMADLVGEVMRNKYANIDDLPAVPYSTLPVFKALISVREDSKACIPDFEDNFGPLVDSMSVSILAKSRLGLEALIGAPETFKYFKRFSGPEVLVELCALLLGFYLPQAVRQDLMLQRFQSLASTIASTVTDLRELGQIETNTNVVGFTMKMKEVGVSEAFEIVLRALEDDVKEFKVVGRALRGLYKKNLRLHKYMRTVETFIDGGIHCEFERWKT